MKASKWEISTNKEKAEFLLDSELVVKKQYGIDPKSKVGDSSCIRVFAVFAGKVQLSNWQDSQVEAMSQAISSLNNWKLEL